MLVNPMIVDGQIIGGVAQGIGTALREQMAYDAHAQPSAATLADYSLPGATEVPMLRIDDMETPSPYTRFGQKGIGEGGAIAPPAAIANAVNDALAGIGARIDRLPITPHRVAELMAGEIAASFGAKLAADLRGDASPPPPRLSAMGLIIAIFRRWLGGITGRR